MTYMTLVLIRHQIVGKKKAGEEALNQYIKNNRFILSMNANLLHWINTCLFMNCGIHKDILSFNRVVTAWHDRKCLDCHMMSKSCSLCQLDKTTLSIEDS